MAFFKPGSSASADRRLARVEALIWILIYAGLLLLVLGLAMTRYDAALAWTMMATGAVLAALGALLIYLRSKMTPP
ncbi:MAG: hypothetical protein LH479_12280 [Polaromonas sp.]|nr:hypothetical protein [Polaromonas sp.]